MASVAIAVGRPGVDHDAVAYSPATGTLAPSLVEPAAKAISVVGALAKIAARLPAGAPC